MLIRTIALIICGAACGLSVSAFTPQAQPEGRTAAARTPANETIATLLTADAVRAQLAKMTVDRPTQEHQVVERVGAYRLSIEHRKLPQRPALHQEEGELWVIIDGTATITTGGKIEGAAAPTAGSATQAPGNVFGKVITGGVANQVGPGDFVLIPEGVPHQITAASSTLKFVVFEFTRPKTGLQAF